MAGRRIKASFRTAKGNPNHNDNTYENERSEHVIEKEKSKENIYMSWTPDGIKRIPGGQRKLYQYDIAFLYLGRLIKYFIFFFSKLFFLFYIMFNIFC